MRPLWRAEQGVNSTRSNFPCVCVTRIVGGVLSRMRLSVGTVKGRWVNVHLLGCPDDSEHVEELKRLLGRFRFKAFDDSFSCSRDDLVRLGRRANPALADDKAALSHWVETALCRPDPMRASVTEETALLKSVSPSQKRITTAE